MLGSVADNNDCIKRLPVTFNVVSYVMLVHKNLYQVIANVRRGCIQATPDKDLLSYDSNVVDSQQSLLHVYFLLN